jgi:hypothetical protein
MRSLKNLINKKKPLVGSNTGIFDLPNIGWDHVPNHNGRIYNNISNIIDYSVITNGELIFNNLPTNPVGLPAGSVWRDVNNILRIV